VKGVQCALCGQYFTQLTMHHLRTHGISTMKEYRDNYGPTTTKQLKEELEQVFAKKELADLAIAGMTPEDWVSVLAESGLRIFSAEARNATLNSAYVLAQLRLNLFQKSATLMSKVLDELNKPWRTTMDEQGKPLSIKELAQLGELAQLDMKNSVEIIMRLTSYIVQDNKGVIGREGQGDKVAFSGEFDKSSIPGEVPPQMREKLRILMDNLDKAKEDGVENNPESESGKENEVVAGVRDTKLKGKEDEESKAST